MKYARIILTVFVIGMVGCESSEVNNPSVTNADSSATEISEAFEFNSPTFEGRASLVPQDMRIVPLDEAQIAVEIRRADGSLDTDAAGKLLPRGADYGFRSARNDGGRLTFTGLAPGPYKLHVAFGRGNNQSARQKIPHRLNFSRECARNAVRRWPDLVVDVNVTAGENDLVEVRDSGGRPFFCLAFVSARKLNRFFHRV